MGQVLLTLWASGSLVWVMAIVLRSMLSGSEARRVRMEIESLQEARSAQLKVEMQRLREAERAEELSEQAHRVTSAMTQDALFRRCPWCGEQRHHPFLAVGDGKPGRVRWMVESASKVSDRQAWAKHMTMPYEQVEHPLHDKPVWAIRQSWQDVFPVVRTCASCGSEWGQIAL